MKTKQPASSKKQNVTLRDLKTAKNPKGGTGAFACIGNAGVPPRSTVTLQGQGGNDTLSGARRRG